MILITNDMSIDSETAKQIEDAKAGSLTWKWMSLVLDRGVEQRY